MPRPNQGSSRRRDRIGGSKRAFAETVTLVRQEDIHEWTPSQRFLVLSPPGMGKSEMVYEARRRGPPMRSLTRNKLH